MIREYVERRKANPCITYAVMQWKLRFNTVSKRYKKQFLELLVSVKVNIQYLLRIETYHWLCYKQMGVSCAEC